MSSEAARVEPQLSAESDGMAESRRIAEAPEPATEAATDDVRQRPAASLTGSMIVRPKRAVAGEPARAAVEPTPEPAKAEPSETTTADRDEPPSPASATTTPATTPSDESDSSASIRAIRQSLRESEAARETEIEAADPEPRRFGGSLSWVDLVIYTSAYLMFLLLTMYFLDLLPTLTI